MVRKKVYFKLVKNWGLWLELGPRKLVNWLLNAVLLWVSYIEGKGCVVCVVIVFNMYFKKEIR